LIFTGNCYRNIRNFFNSILSKLAIEVVSINSTDIQSFNEEFENQYQEENTQIIFIEAPSNPHLYLVDLETLKNKIGKNTLLIVDSTLSTPFNFKPQHLGADLVIHSCSKYIGGHGDIVAGSVAGSEQLIKEIRNYRNMIGGIVAPHCAFLLNRSLETFEIRMKYFNQAGMEVAQYLQDSPLVTKVFYLGLESHPHFYLANKYLTGYGGLISFEIAGDRETTSRFVDSLKVPFMGTNFGSNHPMVEQSSIFTYYKLSAEERQELEITDNLVRLSVGYGNTKILIEDIDQALRNSCRV
jgi:cystathionine gamma-synthase